MIAPPPPLPIVALPAGWAGNCTFNTPGVYTFYCSTHRTEMTGSVTVSRRRRADAHADADPHGDADAGAAA